MGVIIGVIKYLAIVAAFGTMMYARVLYLELKTTRDKLQKAQETIKDLTEELNDVYSRVEKRS